MAPPIRPQQSGLIKTSFQAIFASRKFFLTPYGYRLQGHAISLLLTHCGLLSDVTPPNYALPTQGLVSISHCASLHFARRNLPSPLPPVIAPSLNSFLFLHVLAPDVRVSRGEPSDPLRQPSRFVLFLFATLLLGHLNTRIDPFS